MIQMWVADWERRNRAFRPYPIRETGKRVAVVGAGPAGLAAAEYLRRRGYGVVFGAEEYGG